jgi:hypothetical protein
LLRRDKADQDQQDRHHGQKKAGMISHCGFLLRGYWTVSAREQALPSSTINRRICFS